MFLIIFTENLKILKMPVAFSMQVFLLLKVVILSFKGKTLCALCQAISGPILRKIMFFCTFCQYLLPFQEKMQRIWWQMNLQEIVATLRSKYKHICMLWLSFFYFSLKVFHTTFN